MAKVSLLYFDIDSGYYPGFHHGVASLIGSLKHHKHDISFHHIKLKSELSKISQILKKSKPDVIGLSFTTNQKHNVREFLDKVNIRKPLLIAGGVHCTLSKEQVFEEFPELQAVCIGEGELALEELLRRLERKNLDYLKTPSFYFKNKKNIIKNKILPLADINKLPFPDYSYFDYKKIIRESGDNFAMMLSRGCPFTCSYCSNHIIREVYPDKHRYVRFLSPQRAVSLIENNLKIYPQTKGISFADDTFTINKSWLSDFANLYKQKINIPYLCNGRVETVNNETVKILKQSGCETLSFGVESGNEWLRNNVLNRHHSNKDIENAFSLVKKNRIKTTAYNIVGLPFETKSMAEDTVKLNFKIKPDSGVCFYFYPFPNTKLFDICQEYNLIRNDFSTVAGYLHKPSIKPVFMDYRDMTDSFLKLQLYFHYRRLFPQQLKISGIFDVLVLPWILIFKKQLYWLVNPYNKSKYVRQFARIVQFLYKRLNNRSFKG